MATSLLALLDDIGTLLDDVGALAKVATKKTAGVLGDDLALNAQQVAGVQPSRELPVVWAVMKGSFVNKAILVPAALAISTWLPWAVTPLLMLGGAYLCYEGFEKLAHRFLHAAPAAHEDGAEPAHARSTAAADPHALESSRIKGAVRTDFILSAEIIAITLGTVAGSELATQVLVLSGVAVLMTIGVYGLVAGIVKLDDAGLHLARAAGAAAWARMRRRLGRAILAAAPWLMKAVSVAGTAAMFLVGGGILVHGIRPLQQAATNLGHAAAELPGFGAVLGAVAELLANALAGVVAGAAVFALASGVQRLRRTRLART